VNLDELIKDIEKFVLDITATGNRSRWSEMVLPYLREVHQLRTENDELQEKIKEVQLMNSGYRDEAIIDCREIAGLKQQNAEMQKRCQEYEKTQIRDDVAHIMICEALRKKAKAAEQQIAAKTKEAERDYADMRRFQEKFMKADHKWRDLEEQLAAKEQRIAVLGEALSQIYLIYKDQRASILDWDERKVYAIAQQALAPQDAYTTMNSFDECDEIEALEFEFEPLRSALNKLREAGVL
jgi:chromosome segregation ATPase